MKKQFLMISTVILAVLFSVGGVFAQHDEDKEKKANGGMMEKMHKSPDHKMMTAHKQTVLNFAKALREMSADGKLEDVASARNAFAEIRRGMEKMDETHRSHEAKMNDGEKMKPMMKEMQAEQAAVKERIAALEKALQADAPDAREVEKQAAALIAQLEKMKCECEQKSEMPNKKKM